MARKEGGGRLLGGAWNRGGREGDSGGDLAHLGEEMGGGLAQNGSGEIGGLRRTNREWGFAGSRGEGCRTEDGLGDRGGGNVGDGGGRVVRGGERRRHSDPAVAAPVAWISESLG